MEHQRFCDCDQCLVTQMQAGDAKTRQGGWSAWYQRDGAKLLAFVEGRCRTIHCPEQGEDLLQDCFMIAFRNVSSGRYVDQGKSLCAYLYGIARRLLFETGRLQRREIGFPEGDDAEVIMQGIELADLVCVNEVLERVRNSCGQQPALAQSVVTGIYCAGKSPDELAHELCKSAGNIRTIAHRTVNGIKSDLAKQGIALSTQGVRCCLQELSTFEA